jgi:hypothetical protein
VVRKKNVSESPAEIREDAHSVRALTFEEGGEDGLGLES